jgi:hypothetical protein
MQPTSNLNYSDLASFHGTELVYQHPLSSLCYTDGVRYLAREANCYWLIDVIASYQDELQKEEALQGFQLWFLSLKEGLRPEEGIERSPIRPDPEGNDDAVLSCWYDSPKNWENWQKSSLLKITQLIWFTDFPLTEIKLFVCNTSIGDDIKPLLMLPSEY